MIESILKHRRLIPALFIMVLIISLALIPMVQINYDLLDYLPKDAPSTTSTDKITEIFHDTDDSNGTRVMVYAPDVVDALEIKQQIRQVNNVAEVKWLDDVANIYQPLSFVPSDQKDHYYLDGYALYQVKFNDDDSGKDITAALNDIRLIIGDEGAMAGGAVNNAAAKQNTGSEISTMMLYLIPIVLIIMLIATQSWFEPLLFIATIGIAIIINTGTNALLGSVSFVTQTSAAVLQLAVSMDYSIFLLHAFGDFRKAGYAPREAMALAMKQSFPSIIASAATTILGFLALTLMRFLIGVDMGLVLAKGVIISLASVIFLLPILTLFFETIIEKTHHRSFLPRFERFGKFALKWSVPIVIIATLMIVPSFLAQRQNDFIYGASGITGDETSVIGRDNKRINDKFGKSNQMILMVPNNDLTKEEQLANALETLEKVTSVTAYASSIGINVPTESIPPDKLTQLINNGYSRMIISVATEQESADAFSVVEEIRRVAGTYYEEYYLTGSSVSIYDMKEVVTADNPVVTVAAIIAIGLVIMFTFKSLSLPIILLLSIETAIWINLSFPYFTDQKLIYIGYMIISAVQLGATVDYAILLGGRYMENRKKLPKKQAASLSITETTGSILTSAGILLVAGVIINRVSTNDIIAQLGELIGRGAAISAVSVLFFLPAMLVLFDRLIIKTTHTPQFLEVTK